jgi:hypothetical protein
MSRDRVLEIPGEDARRPESPGRELPRGGRSGSAKRAGQSPAGEGRDALVRQLDLPQGDTRERVWADHSSYSLRGSEVRTLAAVGAFRVVNVDDLGTERGADRWRGDLEHLRQNGLIEIRPHVLEGHRSCVATLTAAGKALLEHHQSAGADEARQNYYAGLVKPREVPHDAAIYRAYQATAARLQDAGAHIRRVVLDYELKREYQRFLQANNRGNRHASGRPDRSPEEIAAWAAAHKLPFEDGHVQFPDVRIEYEQEGRREREDVEVATAQYNARQMCAKGRSGFTIHRSGTSRLGGKGRNGASPFDPHAAEQVLR